MKIIISKNNQQEIIREFKKNDDNFNCLKHEDFNKKNINITDIDKFEIQQFKEKNLKYLFLIKNLKNAIKNGYDVYLEK